MTQQPIYKILLSSQGVEISFDTTDPSFATTQLHQWVRHLFGIDLARFAPTSGKSGVTEDSSFVSVSSSQASAEDQIADVLSQMNKGLTVKEANEENDEEIIEQPVQSVSIAVENTTEIDFPDSDKAAPSVSKETLSTEAMLPVDNLTQSTQNEVEAVDAEGSASEDMFDSFVDTLLSSVDEGNEPSGPASESIQVSLPFDKVMTQASSELEAALDKESSSSMTAVMEPPELSSSDMANFTHPRLEQIEAESLKELFSYAPKASMGEDYLLLSAYFLDRFRGQPAASLREINAELLRSGLTPINHALIEVAVSKGLMELLPDTTGNAFATEYRLTSEGVETLQGLLS